MSEIIIRHPQAALEGEKTTGTHNAGGYEGSVLFSLVTVLLSQSRPLSADLLYSCVNASGESSKNEGPGFRSRLLAGRGPSG